jgi:malate dehydrogenase (quinone)
MLEVMQRVFKDKVASPAWQEKLHQIVPSYGTRLNDDPGRVYEEWKYTSDVLQLAPPPDIRGNSEPNAPTNSDPVGQKHSDSDPDLAL